MSAGVGQQAAAGRDGQGAEREVVGTFGGLVAVEQHLLGRTAYRARAADRLAGEDGVLQPFLGAGVVVPSTVAGRHVLVGLLDPRAELLEEFLPQPGEMRQSLLGVGVLGLEVGADRRVVAVAEPGVLVHPLVVVVAVDERSLFWLGRVQHAPTITRRPTVRPSRPGNRWQTRAATSSLARQHPIQGEAI